MLVVAICTPSWSRWSAETRLSLRCLKYPHAGGSGVLAGETHFLDTVGKETSDARRILTRGALQIPGLTHILWVDDDMKVPSHALERLLSWDLDIVGGLCFSRHGPTYHPILARFFDRSWAFGQETFGFCYDYPPDTRFEVDATGAACLLVKADVFRKIEQEWGEDPWWDRMGGMGEDFSFCRRAKHSGYKVFVDTGLEIGHLAEVLITSKTAAALRPYQWERWNPALTREESEAGKPRASIIIPTYNQDPTRLKAAVMSALAQTVPVEVIVVDDGTTDYKLYETIKPYGANGPLMKTSLYHPVGTDIIPEEIEPDDVCLPLGAKLIQMEENGGVASALNAGIERMTTDWFCWLASDDLFDPRKVEYQLAALEQAGAKAGCHSYMLTTGEEGHFKSVVPAPEWRNLNEQKYILGQICAVNGSTVMIHRDVFDRVGVFDTGYRYGQDWEMWARIGREFLWHCTGEILGTRWERDNLTSAIEVDPEKLAVKNAEDARIRATYGTKCPCCGA